MRIIIDVMSGDNAPFETIKGAALAAQSFKADITVVGNEGVIRRICSENGWDTALFGIVHADSVITMEDQPLCVVREKSDSSMSVGLKMLAEGKADAFISAGNTGALHAGSTLLVRRIKGVKRSAIATLLPFQDPLLLIDSGANTEVTKEQLEQFAVMGSIYMSNILGVSNPRVGLANIGTEPTKGPKNLFEAYEYLSASENINFIGNIEGKQIPFSNCDVLVCDGFTGNTILKVAEGVSSFMLKKLKSILTANVLTKLSALTFKSKLTEVKNSFSASDYGGAPMLGISKPVIKAHGSSDAEEIKNSVGQAIAFISTNVIKEISDTLSQKLRSED